MDVYQEAVDELHSLRDMIRWAVSRFNEANLTYGHGAHSAWDEAVYLLLSTLHLAPDMDDRVIDANLTKNERKEITEQVKRRVEERIPAAYLRHEAYFAGLKFYVDKRVIVPRSPLAEIIEKSFSPWVQEDTISSVLDLCTGSGCIAIACAFAFPESKVDAVDLSNDALAVADRNVKNYHLEDRVHLIKSDLFTELSGKKYDIIVSNPPYVSDEDWKELPQEYHHEPSMALKAGKEGLDFAEKILRQAKNYLSSQGVLIVEVGDTQHVLMAHYPKVPFTWLEFERGEDGVFLLTKEQLEKYF